MMSNLTDRLHKVKIFINENAGIIGIVLYIIPSGATLALLPLSKEHLLSVPNIASVLLLLLPLLCITILFIRQSYKLSLIDRLLNNSEMELNSIARYIINRSKRGGGNNKHHIESVNLKYTFQEVKNVLNGTVEATFHCIPSKRNTAKFSLRTIGNVKGILHNTIKVTLVNSPGTSPETITDIKTNLTHSDSDTKSHNNYQIEWEIPRALDVTKKSFSTAVEFTWERAFTYDEIEYFVCDPKNYGAKVDKICLEFTPPSGSHFTKKTLYRVRLHGLTKAKIETFEENISMPYPIEPPDSNYLYLIAVTISKNS